MMCMGRIDGLRPNFLGVDSSWQVALLTSIKTWVPKNAFVPNDALDWESDP